MWLPSARHRQLPDTGSKVAGLPFCRLQGKLLQEEPRKSRAGEGVAGGGGTGGLGQGSRPCCFWALCL